ncbi:MAG: alpha/beta hydrolase-fold protein [Bacteroidia bacterium]|nr:alpha/beta hydrolase-fold protein [Bacteroidia bacterium]
MKTFASFAFLILYSLSLNFLIGQEEQYFEHKITSSHFEAERKVKVFLPDRYLRDTTGQFAIIFVLDAQYEPFWQMAKGNISYMVTSYVMLPSIIVGIHSDDRGSDFTPPARDLRKHIKEEVIPLIKEKYRVNDFRAVIGHSWGGAFVGSTLFSEDRDLFSAYIGISPSFDANDYTIIEAGSSLLKEGKPLNKYLYASAGDLGFREAESAEGLHHMDSLLNAHKTPGVVYDQQIFKGLGHWGCVIPSLSDGLVRMSREVFADQGLLEEMLRKKDTDVFEQLEAFHKKAQDTYDFYFEPSPSYYQSFANDLREQGQLSDAVIFYKKALEMDPEHARATVNLADAYDKLKMPKEAKAAFERTLVLLEEQKDSLPESFYTNVKKWAKEKVDSYK